MSKWEQALVVCLIIGVIVRIYTLPVDWDAGACNGGYATHIFDKYSDELVQKYLDGSEIDSQAPNKVVKEWLEAGGLYPKPVLVCSEKKHGNSRVDFYLEAEKRKAFIEVKGVTLEDGGVAAFPDAPTERGVKHIYHLLDVLQEGYEAYLVFVIQFKPVKYFIPNDATHPQFGKALREAVAAGVKVLAYDCLVTPDSMQLEQIVQVQLSN